MKKPVAIILVVVVLLAAGSVAGCGIRAIRTTA
jgi:predicted small secreted protein